MTVEGWEGWDEYAPFYDWENSRTLGRRDVPFWRRLVRRERGPVLELGCGTGRVLIPLARDGIAVTGVDRSAPMLDRARARIRRLAHRRVRLARADIRDLPFRAASFGAVLAPYGILQSLVADGDMERAIAEAARVLKPDSLFAADLVPDLPAWDEYANEVTLRGKASGGATVTLIESVKQDRALGRTIFQEEFVERRHGRATRRRFALTFRTAPLQETVAQIEKAGLRVDALHGDYQGRPWAERAEVWLILARKK